MKSAPRYIFFLFVAAVMVACLPDYGFKPVCRVENGRIIFKIDKRWTAEQRKEELAKYELDSSLVAKALSGKGEIMADSVLWSFKQVNPFFSELSKALDNRSGDFLQKNEVLIINDSWIRKPFFVSNNPFATPSISNKFKKNNAFTYRNGNAQFYLPGHKDASNVYLSGTFNDWSTMKAPMVATDSGWIATIKLQPGKYLYKYIIDGKWATDPGNGLEEPDEQGIRNSVVFCPNHMFILKGKRESKKVIVTGNFTNWTRDGITMERSNDGWFLDAWFKEGTYTYKFIADGQWMEDPDNPDNRMDANGNMNSFFLIGDQYMFRLPGYLNCRRVVLVGSFNNWRQEELVMVKDSEGWKLSVALAPGNYEYKFIADREWLTDPANPLKTGSGEYTNSFMVFKPNHTFVLENYPEAANVDLAGSFNNWKADSYRMVKKDGKWSFPLFLAPGKYTYKFIVDRKWILDPANELYEANEYGTNNSVLWIEK